MKKSLILAFVLAIFASGAFATNIEFAINFSGTPFENIKNQDGDEFKPFIPAGIENQWGIYFDSPKNFLDIGISFSYGTNFIFAGDQTISDSAIKDIKTKFATENFVTLAPAFRFNFGRRHSFSVAPGVAGFFNILASKENKDVTFQTADADKDNNKVIQQMNLTSFETGMYLAADLDLGYKFWLFSRENLNFGFDAGYEFSMPLFGKFQDSNIKIGGTSHKIYAGIILNFGTRRIEDFSRGLTE